MTGVVFNQNNKVVLSSSLDGTVRAFDMTRYLHEVVAFLFTSEHFSHKHKQTEKVFNFLMQTPIYAQKWSNLQSKLLIVSF